MESHSAVTGNTGFLGVPMLVVLLGPAAVGPVLLVLALYALAAGLNLLIPSSGARPPGPR